MSKNSRGLGRGFDSLIPTDIIEEEFDVTAKSVGTGRPSGESVQDVAVGMIEPNPHQPRQNFDPETLSELAASIKTHGIIQPLIAVPAEGGKFQLVAGERRWRAAKEAGLQNVPVIVRTQTEQQQMEVALIENLQRADLNLIETATAYRKLADQFNMNDVMIAEKVGRSRPAVNNTMRLLKLPAEAKRAVVEKKILEGHARAILSVPPERQLELLDMILENGWGIKQTEDFVKSYKKRNIGKETAAKRASVTNEWTEQLGRYLGTKVKLHHKAKGAGRLEIEYYSQEELNRIIDSILADRAEK